MARKKADKAVCYMVTFNEEDNSYIVNRAERRGKTPEEQIQDSAVGRGGNKRKKDMDTQRELTNLTVILNKLQDRITDGASYSELYELAQCAGKEVITICHL